MKLVAQTKYIVENVRAFLEKEKSKGYMNKQMNVLDRLSEVSEPQEEDQSQTNTNVGNQEMLDKDRSYENSVVNTNVGNQEMMDKDKSYENFVVNPNVGNQEMLDKDKSYENSVVNTNVGNQEMMDKNYYENSHEKDSAGPWEQRPRK